MRVCFFVIGFLIISTLPIQAKTVRDLLAEEHVPLGSFDSTELSKTVGGFILLGGPEDLRIAFEVVERKDDPALVYVLRFSTKTGRIVKSKIQRDKTEICSGTWLGMAEADDYTLLMTHISPSAGCILALDEHLKLSWTLYGFGPTVIARNLVVVRENVTHFAPVHAERLQAYDLSRGTSTELYPPMDDALRAKLTRLNAEHMPAKMTCERMNDPCRPDLFDELVLGLTTGSGTRFAFITQQSVSHATESEQTPVTVAAQSVLYLYAPSERGWMYCQVQISDTEAAQLTKASMSRSWRFGDTEGRCTPSLPVMSDTSDAPFQAGDHPSSNERQLRILRLR